VASTGDRGCRVNSIRLETRREALRLTAGLKRAVEQGKQLGRPKGIRKLLRSGVGINTTARKVGVGTGTVRRIKQEMPGFFDDAAEGSGGVPLERGAKAMAVFRDYDPDDPVYNEGPRSYSPHWARTLIEPKQPSRCKSDHQFPVIKSFSR
jgi:hypothetical protein